MNYMMWKNFSFIIEIIITTIILTQVVFPLIFNYSPLWVFKKNFYQYDDEENAKRSFLERLGFKKTKDKLPS